MVSRDVATPENAQNQKRKEKESLHFPQPLNIQSRKSVSESRDVHPLQVPSQVNLRSEIIAVLSANPEYGTRRISQSVKARRPEWAVPDTRIRSLLQRLRADFPLQPASSQPDTSNHLLTTKLSRELTKAFEDTEVVALDVEGVDHGRNGNISLVQLAVSPNKCFLLDLLNKTKDDPLVNWLRVILDSKDIVKIVHDCRMDADAFRYQLEIELSNVHDTSCWHYTITGSEWDGLNRVLSVNGIKENANHDNSVYKKDHTFWATRPLTAQMIERAVGDVTRMFELRASQTSKSSPKIDMEAKALSDAYLNAARTANVEYAVVENSSKDVPAPKFNIFGLRKWTNTLIYPHGDRTKGIYMVYYHHKWALDRVRRAAMRAQQGLTG
jgi:hypothetical protein